LTAGTENGQKTLNSVVKKSYSKRKSKSALPGRIPEMKKASTGS
jgi:hypothetical protein